MSFNVQPWKQVKLQDIISVKHGYAFRGEFFSDNETSNILLTPGNFKIGGGFNDNKFKYYMEDAIVPNDYVLQEDDLIITMTDLSKNGDTLGYPALVKKQIGKQFLHNQRIGKVIFHSEEIDRFYLYYVLCTREYRHHILSTSTGSTVKHTAPNRILDYSFLLPPIQEQRRIAQTLDRLDRKIELNNTINKNLEEVAQTLYKRWFVDFEFPVESGEPYRSSGGEFVDSVLGAIPKKWTAKPLYDIASYINGASFKANEIGVTGIPIVKIAELKGGITSQTKRFQSEKDKKYYINNGDILFSWSGNPETSIDSFIWFRGKGILNQHIFNVIPYEKVNKGYVYTLLKHMKSTFAHIASGKQTTGLGHVTVKDLKKLNIAYPDDATLRAFTQIINPIINKIYNNNLENESLSNTRNILLPKLMSGEIRTTVE